MALTDKEKIHRLFSPRMVPDWLSPEQKGFCVALHDRVYSEDQYSVLDCRIFEIWKAVKSTEPCVDEKLRDCFTLMCREKLATNNYVRREMAMMVIASFVDNMPAWEQDACLQKLCGRTVTEVIAFRDLVANMPNWQRQECWRRFLDRQPITS